MTDPDSTIEKPSVAADAEQPVDSTNVQPDQPEQPDDQQQQQLGKHTADNDGASQHQEHQQQQQAPLAQFHPLFTLVTDATSRAAHHPRVHYIFSDDDPDILTDALAQYSHQNEQQLQHQRRQSPAKGPSSSDRALPQQQLQSSSSPAPPPVSSDRAIVLDLVPKAAAPSSSHENVATTSTASFSSQQYEVAWASSLSADWAVVSAKLSAMPDDDTSARGRGPDDHDQEGGDAQPPQQQRFMLHIEGIDSSAGVPTSGTMTNVNRARKTSAATRRPSLGDRDLRGSSGSVNSGDKGATSASQQQQGKEDYGVIVDEFGKRMGVLRKVLDAGLERQRKVAAATTTDDGGAGHEVALANAPTSAGDDDDNRNSNNQQQQQQQGEEDDPAQQKQKTTDQSIQQQQKPQQLPA